MCSSDLSVSSCTNRPDSELTGLFVHDETEADVDGVLLHIEEAREEAERRQRGRDEAEAAHSAE